MLAIYSENHTKHTNTFFEQSIGFIMSHVVQKCILATGSCSFKAWTTIALQGHSRISFLAFRADVFATLVSWADKFSMTFSSRLIL